MRGKSIDFDEIWYLVSTLEDIRQI